MVRIIDMLLANLFFHTNGNHSSGNTGYQIIRTEDIQNQFSILENVMKVEELLGISCSALQFVLWQKAHAFQNENSASTSGKIFKSRIVSASRVEVYGCSYCTRWINLFCAVQELLLLSSTSDLEGRCT